MWCGNAKVEFESTPIRHIAVQCPICKSWFHGSGVFTNDIRYEHEISHASCICPICNISFTIPADHIKEDVVFPEFYEKCLHKVVKQEWVAYDAEVDNK